MNLQEGRAYLYNFDFLKFRRRAEESIKPVNPFILQGICWKFRFWGALKVYVNGKLVFGLGALKEANAFELAIPYKMQIGDEDCIEVIDTEPRWFRWFRPNTAHVVLEGLESAS